MPYEFYLGVDVDDASSDVVLSLVEKEQYRGEKEIDFHVRVLERRSGSDPAAVVQRIGKLLAENPYVGRTRVVVSSGSKAGKALVEALNADGLSAVAATLTGGKSDVRYEGGTAKKGTRLPSSFVVSQAEVVANAASVYERGSLKMQKDTEEISSLAPQLQGVASAEGERNGRSFSSI